MCARARTYDQHMANKNFQLEHTKPLFNEKSLLTLHHLYIYHTFIDTLKTFKYRVPISIFSLFEEISRNHQLKLSVPNVKLDVAKHNFVFQASCIWNEIIHLVLSKCSLNKDGIIVPGSSINSDLSISISVAKHS